MNRLLCAPWRFLHTLLVLLAFHAFHVAVSSTTTTTARDVQHQHHERPHEQSHHHQSKYLSNKNVDNNYDVITTGSIDISGKNATMTDGSSRPLLNQDVAEVQQLQQDQPSSQKSRRRRRRRIVSNWKHRTLQLQPRIVGGEVVPNHSQRKDQQRYPYMVALVNRQFNLVCGGTLIAPQIVLTAAHCAE